MPPHRTPSDPAALAAVTEAARAALPTWPGSMTRAQFDQRVAPLAGTFAPQYALRTVTRHVLHRLIDAKLLHKSKRGVFTQVHGDEPAPP